MERKIITVGQKSGDLAGNDNFPIQAAIDYLSYIGGGTVKVGEGVYHIDSSVHLRSNVSIEGVDGKTVFKKCANLVSTLAADGDHHESQITLKDPEGFDPGQTVTIRAAGMDHGFEDTVAVITGKEGNILYLDRQIYRNNLMSENAIAEKNFSVICGYDCCNVSVKSIIIDGNKEGNSLVGGCRNGGIYLFRTSNAELENCTVRDYNGDGISYQGCMDVVIRSCECINNSGKGIHPGSGTERTTITGCKALNNSMDGIFLCWRVRHSVVEYCISAGNKMSGLSIGHKDTNNIIRNNEFSENDYYGIFFRNEPDPMGANFNIVENNLIEDNGKPGIADTMGYVGIRVRGGTNNVRFINNRIVFVKAPPHLTIGICMEEHTFDNYLEGNQFVNCRKEFHNHWLAGD
jgi:parallel beta-helix repeat protein